MFSVRTILWLDRGVAGLSHLERSVGHAHEVSRFLQPLPVGYDNFLQVSLPRPFPPKCQVECPSDHGRHECVLPCLLVLLLSPLLTLVPTAESTVFVNVFVIRSRRGASENLFAMSHFVLVPAYSTLPFPERREGGQRRWGYRELQTLLVSVCGDQLVTFGYFVHAILGFRAVSSESLAVLVAAGAWSARFPFMIFYLVYEVGLNLGFSCAWMVQLG